MRAPSTQRNFHDSHGTFFVTIRYSAANEGTLFSRCQFFNRLNTTPSATYPPAPTTHQNCPITQTLTDKLSQLRPRANVIGSTIRYSVVVGFCGYWLLSLLEGAKKYYTVLSSLEFFNGWIVKCPSRCRSCLVLSSWRCVTLFVWHGGCVVHGLPRFFYALASIAWFKPPVIACKRKGRVRRCS